jgi:hypothetical protein
MLAHGFSVAQIVKLRPTRARHGDGRARRRQRAHGGSSQAAAHRQGAGGAQVFLVSHHAWSIAHHPQVSSFPNVSRRSHGNRRSGRWRTRAEGSMTPLHLTDDQLRCVMQAARRVPVSARDKFLQEVAEELGGREPRRRQSSARRREGAMGGHGSKRDPFGARQKQTRHGGSPFRNHTRSLRFGARQRSHWRCVRDASSRDAVSVV